MPIRLAARGKCRGRVGRHDLVVNRRGQLMARAVEMYTGVVDKAVEPAGLVGQFSKRGLDARLIGHVARDVDEAARELHGFRCFGALAFAREATDSEAAAREFERDRGADAAARASDCNYFFCSHQNIQNAFATEIIFDSLRTLFFLCVRLSPDPSPPGGEGSRLFLSPFKGDRIGERVGVLGGKALVHLSLNRGLRLAMNASMPSAASSVQNASVDRSASILRPSLTGLSSARLTASRAKPSTGRL